MEARRLFAGVRVDATEALRGLLAELRREWAGERIRWTRPENWHLTVEFFGETPEGKIPELEKALAAAAGEAQAFGMEIAGLGTFGSPRHPRVVWLGIESAGLVRLRECVQAALREAGWQPEAREFAPHLTLGRIERPQEPRRFAETVDRLRGWAAERQAAKELILFESAAGRYVPIGRWELGKIKNEEF